MKKLILLLLLATSAISHAAVYYVATTGSDSAPGTQAQPWKTISHAAGVAVAGDTVLVGNGVYQESPQLTRSGTSGSHIVFQSQNKYGAVIQPSNAQISANSGKLMDVSGAFVTVQDFEFVGTDATMTGIKCNGGTGCSLIGNKIHEIGQLAGSCPSGAAILEASDNAVITRNILYDVSPVRTAGFRCNHQQGIYITGNVSGATLQDNVIFAIWQGWAIQMDGGTFNNNTIGNNTVFNSGDNGHASGGIFYLNCAAGTCSNNTVTNNICFSTQGGTGFIYQDSAAPGGTWGSDNVFDHNLASSCDNGANHMLNGNVVTNTVTANPLFVHYTGDQTGDYHLQAESPAIGAGASIGAPSIDFDGTAQTLPPTIGALSLASASRPDPPTGLVATVR